MDDAASVLERNHCSAQIDQRYSKAMKSLGVEIESTTSGTPISATPNQLI
jgi:hypothetical protein